MPQRDRPDHLTAIRTPADIADSTGAQQVLHAALKRWPSVKHLMGDAAHDRRTPSESQVFQAIHTYAASSAFRCRWGVSRAEVWPRESVRCFNVDNVVLD